MILVDTNILIYALNEDSSKHHLAKKFLKERKGNLALSHQNIFEAVRVLTHPKFGSPISPKQAVRAILDISAACKIISPNQKSQMIALEFVKHLGLTGNQVFDAYLAATALSNEVTTIATDNEKHFQDFVGIKIFNPIK